MLFGLSVSPLSGEFVNPRGVSFVATNYEHVIYVARR